MSHDAELFISYSQDDGDAALVLLDRFRTAGIKCFLAEKSLRPGTEWDVELRAAIRNADHVLVLVTPRSKLSVWVAAEVGAAWVLGKPVIPALQSITAKDLSDGPLAKFHARKIESRAQIDELVNYIKSAPGQGWIRGSESGAGRATGPDPTASRREDFLAPGAWDHLLRVGDWTQDKRSGAITGSGMYRYLLSSQIHGTTAFKASCRLTFLALRPESAVNAVNAGIVVGWSVPSTTPRYLCVTFSGTSVFLERVGYEAGDEYWDYEHLTSEVPFPLREYETYDLDVDVQTDRLTLYSAGRQILSHTIRGPLTGRIGLRAWRSTLRCDRFVVE